jgi:hypothetical protein
MTDEQHQPDDHREAPDAQLDALLRDAARTYRRPPGDGGPPDAEALWSAIDRALDGPAPAERPALTVVRGTAPRAGRTLWRSPWLRTAAGLLLGVAIGRASVRRDAPAGVPRPPAPATATAPAGTDAATPSDAATSAYLGRAEALLAALPGELRARRADPAYLSRADALLLQTRLLLDSPTAADPALRSLFDDLEVVLAQVVRLRADRDPARIDFLEQALEQRDVLPRLRDAVADNAVADNAAN